MVVLVFDKADSGHQDNCESLSRNTGKLETEALSSTSTLDHKGVLSLQSSRDDSLLPGLKRWPSKKLGQQTQKVSFPMICGNTNRDRSTV